jgi:hypothetical protein
MQEAKNKELKMPFNINDILNLNQNDQDNLPPIPMRMDQPAAPAEINPVVKDYLAKKYALPRAPADTSSAPDSVPVPAAPTEPSVYDKFAGDFSPEKYQQAKDDADKAKSGLGVAQLIAGIGDAFAGRSSGQTAQNFDNIRKGIDNKYVGDFDKRKAAAIQDIGTKKTMDAMDPNSPASKAMQQSVSKMLPGVYTPEELSKLSAADSDLVLKPAEMRAKLDERKAELGMRAEMMKQNAQDRADKKTDSDLFKVQSLAESQRGSAAVAQAEKDLYAASKVHTLRNMFPDPNKMNPQMVNLFVQDVSKIANGGQPSQHELEGMNPNTWSGDLAKAWQKLSNQPTPANQGAFIKQYENYANALSSDAKKVILDKYGRVLDPYAAKYKDNPTYQAMRKKYVDRFDNDEPSGGTVMMKDPKGNIRQVPVDQVEAAKAAGGTPL